MTSPAAASGLVIILLSVSVVQGHSGYGVTYTPKEICAVEGSTVDIQCSYRYPNRGYTTVDKQIWFTKWKDHGPVDLTTDAAYVGRVTYTYYRRTSTLRISDLRKSDTDKYKFRFTTKYPEDAYTGLPEVSLSVSALWVNKWNSNYLYCRSTCQWSSGSYIWYKNGKEVPDKNYEYLYFNSLNHKDSVACAINKHKDFPSPSVCVRGDSCYIVNYSNRNLCALKGSSVDISCSYNSNNDQIRSKFWFSPGRSHQWQNTSQPEDLRTDSQYEGRVQIPETAAGRSTLRISDLTDTDSAQYRFKFTTTTGFEWGSSLPGTTLTVTDVQVQVSRSSTGIQLNCVTSCHPGVSSYVWYRDGQQVNGQTSQYYAVSVNDRRSFACALKDFKDLHSPLVCVNDQSCNRVTYTKRNLCAPKGSSVNISCTYNSYDRIQTQFWFRPERSHQWHYSLRPQDLRRDSQYEGRVQVLETAAGRSTLRISDLTDTDSAQYCFKFTTTPWSEWRSSLPGTALTVTDPLQVQVTRVKVHSSYIEAELKCLSSCSPAAPFVWFKNGKPTVRNSSYKVHLQPGDIIYCALEGYLDFPSPSVYAPEPPSVSLSPRGEIVEGSSVTLTCSSDANPAASYTWYKENRLVSKEPQLFLNSIQPSASGEYHCTAENKLGRRTSNYTINVKYPPKTISLSVSPSGETVEDSSVTLKCSSDANPAASYTWYKENRELVQEPKGLYHFPSISSEDRGNYSCKSENQLGQKNSSSLFLNVQYAPKRPSVTVSPSGEIVEDSSVTLTCSSDANPAASYTWYRENEGSPKASGQMFTISNFRPEHSGNYYCEALNTRGRHKSTLHLTVGTGSLKSAAVGSITVIFLALVLLSTFLLIRRRRSRESRERPDNRAQKNGSSDYEVPPPARAQRKAAEQQDDLLYSAVSFSKNQEDPLYSNIMSAQSNTRKREEEEEEEEDGDVEYTLVRFSSATPGWRPDEGVEDSSAVYSTVSKNHRV